MILPFLARKLDPQIVEHICRSASYLREQGSAVIPDHRAAVAVPPAPSRVESFALSVEATQGFKKTAAEIGLLPADCWMDAAALKGRTLEVRRWRAGDWMRPSGFPHRRKLQDIFVTAKTPPSIRHSLPVVADAETGEVLWIPGYRVSESVKVPSPSAASVHFSLIRT